MLPTASRLTKNRLWLFLLCLTAVLSLPGKALAAQNINIDATNWWSYSGSLTTGSTYNVAGRPRGEAHTKRYLLAPRCQGGGKVSPTAP